MGVPVVLEGAAGAALVLAAETLGPARLAAAQALGRPVLAITGRRAATLKARAYDGDVARVVLPAEADTAWIAAVADPADDLSAPMKGPLRTEREGDATLHRAAIRLAKAARLLPAALVLPLADPAALAAEGLTTVSAAAVAPHELSPFDEIVAARVPLELAEASRLHIFRPDDGAEEHYAIEIGAPDRAKPVLSRLHSACFTGDLLGSLKCDCGPQLRAALGQMGREGEGILLYLNQEGRGIGLANKMRAYSLQDQGFDTVEANHRLGFEDDERDFRIGAALLRELGFGRVRLMTNNPAKVARLESCGIAVTERVPLKVGETRFNHHYLATKAKKSGHLL
ncbi:3,4-dihydroxy-2-butanone 4-phosphate synthase/GTP cyclohydrolase II [Oceanicola granulosus HTCC2516]|uniref:GTP cyclohydrolase-2 n=2 Tax=Oceanicola granulosus TaxID=252302 RepID=Q2CBC5_OCEGH|nr:3,4-dihydroxy-2-butanone 4-phosphate synthase/GTP cyclohydrolase II [Oceanicola granulosus HTCC2516]